MAPVEEAAHSVRVLLSVSGMSNAERPTVSSDAAPAVQRAVRAIEEAARAEVAALASDDLLDAIDLARERLLAIAEEHGGLRIGDLQPR